MTRRLRKKKLLHGCVGIGGVDYRQWRQLRWWAEDHPKWDTTDHRVNKLLQRTYKAHRGRRERRAKRL